MNHSLRFLLAGLLMGLFLVSCEKHPDESETDVDVQEMDDIPVEDQLTVKISRPTYVFPSAYTGEGKAVVERVAKETPLEGADLEVAIFPGSQIPALTEDQLELMLGLLVDDGTLVFIEPELPQLDAFCKAVAELGERVDWGKYITDEAVQRVLFWGEVTPFEDLVIDGEKDQFEVVALRAKSLYLSLNERENIPEKEKMIIWEDVSEDDGKEDLRFIEIEFEDQNEITDYYFGCKADDLAGWINEGEESPEEENARRASAAALLATRAGSEFSLERLVKSQRIILNASMTISFRNANGSVANSTHPARIQYDIWGAYSEDKKIDYYCVKQSITSENQRLHCGPSEPREWWGASGFDRWIALNKQVEDDGWFLYPKSLYPHAYGAYMKDLEVSSSLEGLTPNIDQYFPMNNTAGGINVTESFSYTLGGSLGFSGAAPAGSFSGNATWGTSISRFNPDLAMTANVRDGKLMWTYSAPHVKCYYNEFLTSKHDFALPIQTNTCTVEHAWVWSVATTAETVNLTTSFKLVDEWLTYDRHRLSCTEYYIPHTLEKTFKSVVNCPPRHKQEWVMTVEPTNMQTEAYLKDHLKNYFLSNFTLCTRKATHAAQDSADEISAFVAESKGVFDKNQSVMKQAAEAGKISGYTIRWHNVKVAGNDDDFTYEVK
ncbi:MAG: hypothetical protein IJG35_08580 [Bacteroidales bacterium]|nr:hypothetical protein [Bacteroidales bacterium]